MAMVEINWNPKSRELRQFAGIWFPAFWLIIGLFVHNATNGWAATFVLWGAVAVISIVGVIRPAVIRPIFVGMMLMSYPIGWVMSHILLGIIFYLLITPIGLLMRLLGRDPMERKFERSASTYWIPRNSDGDTRRYTRQF